MNTEILFCLLLGHLVGDYLAQNSWMAFNKKNKDRNGVYACVVHCCIYTEIVFLFLILSNPVLLVNIAVKKFILIPCLIFLSHYLIDRYHVVEWWLDKIKARSWDTHIDLNAPSLSTKESMYLSFGAIQYVVADNTLHLVLMYLILKAVL